MSGKNSRQLPPPPAPKPTGRTIIVLKSNVDTSTLKNEFHNKTGMKTYDSRELYNSTTSSDDVLLGGNALFIDRFKIAVIPQREGDVVKALAQSDSVEEMRPEFYLYAIDKVREMYVDWIKQGLHILAEGSGSVLSGALPISSASVQLETEEDFFQDTRDFTWGLQAVRASDSQFSGQGVRIAVLDTGIDLSHPDFAGRSIITNSFVKDEDIHDVQGHGTHTAGTIAGPAKSIVGRRYGVAPNVELYVGKVLNNSGSGKEIDIIDGMNWAIDHKCVAISMSLGRPTAVGEKPDPVYERTGTAALKEGSLIIAAAGNESARDYNYIAPVGAPANCKSIFSVSAINPKLQIASFSCGGLNTEGGDVNLSAPGVSVYSSFPLPRESRVLQGTSMACPHVSGVAALWAESDPSLRGQKLWDKLLESAVAINSTLDKDDYKRDFGKGLVQSPQAGASV